MMKNLVFLFSLCLLGACAGNPPQWWNPSGSYGGERQAEPAPVAVQPSLPAKVTPEEEEPYPMEQNIEPSAESYEELDLSPFAQTVELPSGPAQLSQGESKTEQTVSDSAPLSDKSTTGSASVQPSAEVAAEEPLPEDGSLPPPSVLQ